MVGIYKYYSSEQLSAYNGFLKYKQVMPTSLMKDNKKCWCSNIYAIVVAYRINDTKVIEFGFNDNDDFESYRKYDCKSEEEFQELFHEIINTTKDYCSHYKIDIITDWFNNWTNIIETTIGRISNEVVYC